MPIGDFVFSFITSASRTRCREHLLLTHPWPFVIPDDCPLDMLDGSSFSPDGVVEFFDHFFGGIAIWISDAYHPIAFTFARFRHCTPPGFFRSSVRSR
jgi:hypothetical protein